MGSSKPDEANTIPRLWQPGETDSFSLLFRGQPFVEQMVIYKGARSEGHTFDFFWSTHWAVVGGGPATETAARLIADERGRPRVYEIFSNRHAVQRIEFGLDHASVTLTDESAITVGLERPPDFVFQNNIVLQLALALSLNAAATGHQELWFFSPDSLSMRKIEAHRNEIGAWETSLGMTLRLEGRRLAEITFGGEQEVGGRSGAIPIPQRGLGEYRRSTTPVYAVPAEAGIAVSEEMIGVGDFVLHGAFSRPAAVRDRLPGFLFLQGSGAIDRHGMAPGIDVGSHSICDYLSSRGFVGLRIDARGTGATGFGDVEASPFERRVEDARAALAWLMDREEVDPTRVFLIGHSLGTLVALTLLERSPEARVSGVALLAPLGRGLGRILVEQAMREARRLGLSEESIARRRKALAEWLWRIRSTGSERRRTPVSNSFAAFAQREVLSLSPRHLLSRFSGSVLICQGTKDIQVSLERDALPMLAAAEGARQDAELRVFANLDHLFKDEPAKPSPAAYFAPRPVAPRFLESLAGWLCAKTGVDGRRGAV